MIARFRLGLFLFLLFFFSTNGVFANCIIWCTARRVLRLAKENRDDTIATFFEFSLVD